MADRKKSKPLKPYMLGRLSEEQDSALDEAAEVLTDQRGTTVARADVVREALAKYLPTIGVVWPC